MRRRECEGVLRRAFGALAILGVLVLTAAGAAEGADSFRCRGRSISLGDTEATVLIRCGDPSWASEWTETIAYENSFPVTILVKQWTYNLGPNSFLRTLRIENGRVRRIETGDYGY
jgi:hypothetical protein